MVQIIIVQPPLSNLYRRGPLEALVVDGLEDVRVGLEGLLEGGHRVHHGGLVLGIEVFYLGKHKKGTYIYNIHILLYIHISQSCGAAQFSAAVAPTLQKLNGSGS